MSRKTTSGADVLSAASTSTPLRHSPATANSGNAASSWRTPRRAAGSSSAINAVHLAGFTVLLRTQFAIRHTQRCDCTAFRTSHEFERGVCAVERAQSFARVLNSVTRRRRRLRIDSGAIVYNCDLQYVANVFGSDEQQTSIRMTRDAVTNRVLYQMLQGETRKCRRE